MANEDRILKILLQLHADTTGATQTQAALKEVQGQATATSTAATNIESSTGGAVGATRLLGGAYAIAALAAFKVYGYISDAIAAQRALNEETLRQNEAIDRTVTAMIRIADKSKDIGDQIKIGDKVEGDLNKLSDKMRELRIREIDAFSTWGQTIEGIFRKTLGAGWLSPQTTQQQQAAAELKATQEAIGREILATNVSLSQSIERTRQWNAASGDLSKGIALFNQELTQAQAKLATLDAGRLAKPADRTALEAYNAQVVVVADLQNKVDLLTSAQARLAVQSQRVADAISKANFNNLDPEHKLQALGGDVDSIKEKLHEMGIEAASPNEALAKASDLIKDDAKQTEAARAAVISLAGAWAQVVGMIGQAVAEQSRMAGEVASLQQHLATVNAEAYGTRDEAYKAEWGEKYNKILQQRQKIGADISAQSINEQIAAEEAANERKKEYAAEDRGAGVRVARSHELVDLKREESALLRDIRQQQQAISSDPFLTDDQKNAKMIPLLQQEREELLKTIAEWQRYRQAQSAAGNTSGVEQSISKVRELQLEYRKLGQQMQSLAFGGQIRTQLTQWANSFGTAAKQVAGIITNTLNTAIASTSQALTSLIFKTGNWKQAFAQAAQSIVQNIIQVALQFVVSRTIMAAINRIFGQTEAQVVNQQASQAAAAWAPAAVSASIASYGAASAAGLAAYVAALAGFTASGVGGGFEKGGWTGSGSDHGIAGAVHYNEYVFDAPATRAIGVDNLESIRSSALRNATVAAPKFMSGGFTGSGGISSSRASSSDSDKAPVINQALFLDADHARKWILQQPAGERHIIDLVRRKSLNLGKA